MESLGTGAGGERLFLPFYLSLFLHDALTVENQQGDGDDGEHTHTDVRELHTTIDDPSEERGSEIERTTCESVRNMSGIIACGSIYLVGCHRKVGSHIGYEIETDNQGYQTDDKGLHYITLGKWQNQWEEVEHTCQ